MADSNGATTVQTITSESDFDKHTTTIPSSALRVIYFHASWAEPCKQMSTVISTLASTYPAAQPPTIAFLSLDAEEVSEVSERYDVTQVPYIVLQRGSSTLETISGGDVSKVRAAVEKHAGQGGSGSGNGSVLPPAQKTTKPAPSSTSNSHAPSAAAGGGDLSSYAPGADAPATAPEYSSGEAAAAAEDKEKLHERLAELVKAAPVMLFMKGTPSAPQCGFSRQTVSLLREKGIRYGFFNILADDEVRQGLKDFSEWPTFPQVYVGGELVGGLDILKEEFENDPEFLADYAVSSKRNAGGPASADQQAAPA